jgi:hypothetical protein
MTSRLIACVSLACALAACDAGPAGPPSPPSSPVSGAEPSGGNGYEPPGSSPDLGPGGGSIAQLCAYDCMRFETICPGSGGGPDCAAQCVQSVTSLQGCEAQFQGYLACLATTPVTCTTGTIDAPGCDGARTTLNNCVSVSGGGTGTAGGSGGSAP